MFYDDYVRTGDFVRMICIMSVTLTCESARDRSSLLRVSVFLRYIVSTVHCHPKGMSPLVLPRTRTVTATSLEDMHICFVVRSRNNSLTNPWATVIVLCAGQTAVLNSRRWRHSACCNALFTSASVATRDTEDLNAKHQTQCSR